jgi:hypothetical protein
MSNEIYTDLENRIINTKEKHELLRMEVIELLVESCPNDADLGNAVREFINLKNN